MKCKVVNIKVALYAYDESDTPVAIAAEDAEEIFMSIRERGDIYGYSITDITLNEEEIDS